VDQVSAKVSEQVSEVSSQILESVTSTAAQVSETITATVSDVSESVQSTAAQVTETVQATATAVSSKAAAVVDFLTSDDDDTDSEDEFETFKTSDAPEFRGMKGLNNFHVLQEDVGIFSIIYDFYIYMLKKPLPEFASAMFAAPVLLSVMFTFLYLPDVKGLALDDTARNFFDAASGEFLALIIFTFIFNSFSKIM
jgi:ABC-type transporter Mla subunit MlaD